ncbi:MAG: serine/threonine-protein phosphatase, partial [Planctomycetes bacterium]|nr:serine/threonine-protein phosphatase [Planctomycetota bacterium]
NPGYLLNAAGDVKAELSSLSMPLGIDRDVAFENSPAIPLEADDLLFLYTDGVVEAAAPDGNAFGVDRALDIMRRLRRQPAAEIVSALQAGIAAFTKTGVRQDDITVVVLRVTTEVAR